MTPGSYGHFPNSFGLYYAKPGSDFLSQNFELGVKKEGGAELERSPFYAVTFFKAPGGGSMTLYSTTTPGSAPLAVATNEMTFATSAAITLPGETSSSDKVVEHIKKSGFSPRGRYTFTFKNQNYDWIEDSTKKPCVRTLVRQSTLRSRSDSSTQAGAERSNEQAEDAAVSEHLIQEPAGSSTVIATWTEGSIPNRQGMLAGMKFADNGIAASLGDYFMLLAVSSVLVACQFGRGVDSKSSQICVKSTWRC